MKQQVEFEVELATSVELSESHWRFEPTNGIGSEQVAVSNFLGGEVA